MPLTELCEGCGLCCNGTLYTHVTLTDDEVLQLKKHPELIIIERDHQPSFSQGCTQHDGKGCRIYKDRPDSCVRYYCAVATAVKRDELSLPEGLAIVEEAQALVMNAREYVYPPPGKPLAVATWEAAPPGLSPDGKLAWERAKAHLVRHFLGPG